MAKGSSSRYFPGASLLYLHNALKKSRILKGISMLYPRLAAWGLQERDCSGGRHAAFFLRLPERSVLLQAAERAVAFLGSLSLGTYGRMLALYGIFSTVIRFVVPMGGGSAQGIFWGLGMMAISLPMLHGKHSLAYEISNSRILGRFLFGFCGCTREEDGACVRHRPWLSLVFAFLLATVGILIPVWKVAVLILGLLGIRLLFRVPEIGVPFLCLVLPFCDLLRLPTVTLATFAALLFIAWLQKALTGKRPLRLGPCELLLLALCLCYLLGGILGAGGGASFLEACVRTLFLLLWFPVRSLLEVPKWRDRAVLFLFASSFLISVSGIVEYFFGSSALQFVDQSRFFEIERRVTVFYSNPNFLALYLTLCAPFSLGLALDQTRHPRQRFLGAIGFFATLLCVIFTWTRGAWLGVGISSVIYLLLWSRKSFLGVFGAPVLLLASIPFLPRTVTSRFLSIGNFGESSIRYRLYTWTGVRRMLSNHPFGIGVGEAAFTRLYPSFAVSGTERVMHAHRLDLQLRVEMGAIGFGIFAVLLVLVFLRSAWLLRTGAQRERMTVLAAFCALIGALVMGVFDYIWYHFGNFLLFWLVAAMGMQVSDREDGHNA